MFTPYNEEIGADKWFLRNWQKNALRPTGLLEKLQQLGYN